MNLYSLYTDALEKKAKVTARRTAQTAALGAAAHGAIGAYEGAMKPGAKKDGTARSRTAGALRRGARGALLGGALGGGAQALADSDKVRDGIKGLIAKAPKTRGMQARALKKQRKKDEHLFSMFGDPQTGHLSDYGQNLAAVGALPRRVSRMARAHSPLARFNASNL